MQQNYVNSTLYNDILCIVRNLVETRENIKIESHPFHHNLWLIFFGMKQKKKFSENSLFLKKKYLYLRLRHQTRKEMVFCFYNCLDFPLEKFSEVWVSQRGHKLPLSKGQCFQNDLLMSEIFQKTKNYWSWEFL